MKHSVSKEDKELLEQDKPWLDAFLQEHYGVTPKKKNAKRVWVTLTACAAAVALVLTLALCLPRVFRSSDTGKTDMSGDKQYSLENQASMPCDLGEINKNILDFSLYFSDNCVLEINRYYDVLYNDTLFYVIRMHNEQTFENVLIQLYVNPDFACTSELELDKETTNINGFDLDYIHSFMLDDPIYTVSYRALTEYSGVTVYIEYTQLSLSENGDFFDFFAQTFLVK